MNSTKIKILMVDDNYDLFRATAAATKNKFDLEYAPDGFTALQLIQNKEFNLVLCDICMPIIDGVSLLREAKKKNLQIPFVLITGNPREDLVQAALHEGAYNLLLKPFTIEELEQKVELALKTHENQVFTRLEDHDRAYVYNALKIFYYDVERIVQVIKQHNISMVTVKEEIGKKEMTGRCMFDDLRQFK